MARIINLDELLPEDMEFHYQGEKYTVAGDISVEQVFRFYDLFSKMREEMAEDPTEEERAAAGKSAVEDLQAELLRVFQIRRPDLQRLPFGIQGTAVVVSHMLEALNPNRAKDGEGDEQSLPPTSKRSSTAGRKRPSTPRKQTPPRSRGSRRS